MIYTAELSSEIMTLGFTLRLAMNPNINVVAAARENAMTLFSIPINCGETKTKHVTTNVIATAGINATQ